MAGLVLLVVGLAFFYLSSRLQFVLFDVVLRRITFIAPIWRRYGSLTWRWMGLKVLFFVAALACMVPLIVPGGIFLAHTIGNKSAQHPGTFVLAILSFVLGLLAAIILLTSAFCLLQDFGLPSLALEATPMRVTVRRVLALVRAEPLQAFLYLLMRLLLAMAMGIACYVVLLLIMLVAVLPFGGLAALLYFGLHDGGLPAKVFMICGWVVLALVVAVLFVMAALMLFGYMLTFFQAYAIYFLAGRYPLLDSILNPAPPAPPPYFPTPPPISFIA